MSVVKKAGLVGLAWALVSTGAYAINWPMLQGTEPENARTVQVFGILQLQYEKDLSDPNTVNPNQQGEFVPAKLIGPDFNAQSGFNVPRAELGVRGRNAAFDADINYFLLTEFGHNGVTANGGGGARLLDASVTVNHIPNARIRAGAFKFPTFEEGYQAVHVMDYLNFTEVGNQLMLEWFPNAYYTGNATATNPLQPDSLNLFEQPVSAFRDVGVQVFDAFRTGLWEHTYAVMLGNGVNFNDNDGNKDTYLYVSTERLFPSEGPFNDGVKFFAWNQRGSRLLDNTNDGIYNPQQYDRTRSGFGAKYLKRPFRATAEYLTGKGMIFQGPDKPTFDQAPTGPLAAGGNGENGKASGWYVEGGWRVLDTNWELDLRYDYFDKLEGDLLESEWKTWTIGVQYHLNPRTRISANYALRDVTSVNFGAPGTAGPVGTGAVNPNNAYDGVSDRWGVRISAFF
jgi:hypothetical protein